MAVNKGSDNMGSTPVDDREHREELRELTGQDYVRVATTIHGFNNRKARRKARYRKPDKG